MNRSVTQESQISQVASIVLHFGFVLTGIVTILLGPILPSLSSRWSLTDAQVGYFFTAQFIGSMVGVAISGSAISKLGFRPALAGGYALTAAGIFILIVVPWPFSLLAVFTYGAGFGLTVPSTNLCISDANPDRRAAALNVLNFMWGAGAVLCAPLVSLFQRIGPLRIFLFTLAVTVALFACVLMWMVRFSVTPAQQADKTAHVFSRADIRSVVALGAAFYLYVGTENSVSGWVAFFARRVSRSSNSLWLLTPSVFWGALLLGRALAPSVLKRVGDIRVAISGLFIAALGTASLIVSHSTVFVFLSAALAGIGLAAVYPIAIAILSNRFGEATSRVAPIVFALASIGGATLPWTVGLVSTHFGNLRMGLLVPLATTTLMIGLYMSSRFTGLSGLAEPSSAQK